MALAAAWTKMNKTFGSFGNIFHLKGLSWKMCAMRSFHQSQLLLTRDSKNQRGVKKRRGSLLKLKISLDGTGNFLATQPADWILLLLDTVRMLSWYFGFSKALLDLRHAFDRLISHCVLFDSLQSTGKTQFFSLTSLSVWLPATKGGLLNVRNTHRHRSKDWCIFECIDK